MMCGVVNREDAGKAPSGIGRLCRSSNSHSRVQSRQLSGTDAFTFMCPRASRCLSLPRRQVSQAAASGTNRMQQGSSGVIRLRHHGECPRCNGVTNRPQGFHTVPLESNPARCLGVPPAHRLSLLASAPRVPCGALGDQGTARSRR
ncbi:Adenylate kinase or related kinase [Pseudomonas syringae pv. actinidiae]|uniref:Adenylate kinase or related kinase n=1 Tax=Pseudomonas syringae pv. actinidiae TaxID=103796 RepID=A0A2V0QFP1_PSESF|nr:Adenylate kinase or related kinase [Pseudomonas syringae pv. actinidiae]